MSFGGSVAAMVNSIKNNRSQLKGSGSKKDDFTKSTFAYRKKGPLKFKNSMSEEEFRKFSEELYRKKKRSILIQSIIYVGIFIGTLILVFGYL